LIEGERFYLWRAVDQDRGTVDILLRKGLDRNLAWRSLRSSWNVKHGFPANSSLTGWEAVAPATEDCFLLSFLTGRVDTRTTEGKSFINRHHKVNIR
jgi:hypothetical protein